jgi:nucleoid DNA-binding protein
MQQLITSYLLQNKECVLPGIGTLSIKNSPASFHAAGKQILPPENEIIFSEMYNSKPGGLINFIAVKKHISINEAENVLNDFSNSWKEKINHGESLALETIGSVKKDNGKIFLEKESSYQFLKPIAVKEIYHAADKISYEEKNIAGEAINEGEIKPKKSYWGIWAAALAVIAFAVIIFYFLNHDHNSSAAANQNKFEVDSAVATYSVPAK